MPFISVIIPVYNAARYVEECVDSVMRQTFGDFDVCLVDDGSHDGSGPLCDALAARDERIRVVHLGANRGVSAARNRGIAETSGDWLCFIDSDDWVTPTYLQELAEAVQSGPYDLVIGGMRCVRRGKNDEMIVPEPLEMEWGDGNEEARLQLFRTYLIFGPVVKLYRRELLDMFHVRFPEGVSYGEDLVFNMNYLQHCRRLRTIETAGYAYRRAEAGTLSTSFLPEKFAWNLVQIRLVREYFYSRGMQSPRVKDYLAHRWWGIVYDALFDIYRFKNHYGFPGRYRALHHIVHAPENGVLEEHDGIFPCPKWVKFCLFKRLALPLFLAMEFLHARHEQPDKPHSLLFYPHGGSGNHGCEAIVRSSMLLLKPKAGVLFSSSPDEDRRYGLDQTVRVQPERRPIRRLSLGYASAFVRRRLLGRRDAFDRLAFGSIFDEAVQADFALCSGGDNYCYGEPVHIYLQNELCRQAGAHTVLWGCSLEEQDITPAMLADLRGFDLIVARESLTEKALRALGIERIVLYPDPAFALPASEIEFPADWQENNMVGINASPMVIGHESRPGAVMENYVRLIEWILAETTMHVALIPHVVWPGNDDRRPLGELYERFRHTGRVLLVPDAPCEELKSLIARCRFLVAARTHASIAAYSTGVPALVVGYSVKARGIARDLFGTEEGHVIAASSLDAPDDLARAFAATVAREDELLAHYAAHLPAYMERLRFLRRELLNLLNPS